MMSIVNAWLQPDEHAGSTEPISWRARSDGWREPPFIRLLDAGLGVEDSSHRIIRLPRHAVADRKPLYLSLAKRPSGSRFPVLFLGG